MPELRKTGIEVLGDISWGSHFCNFYETKQDLLDTLVPYFKTGLESNEFCLWVVSDSGPITVEEAKEALEKNVPDFQQHFSKKDIEILTGSDWYLEEKGFNLKNVMNEWHAKLKQALTRGYVGLRASGDTFWLSENNWKDFFEYEKELNDSIAGHPMTILCTYPLAKSTAAEVLDVAHSHQFAITRRQGEWEVLETPRLIQAKTEIKRLSATMQRVKERTFKPHVLLSYGAAALSVIAALVILLWMDTNLTDDIPHVSVFLCAIIFSTWIGGVRRGLLATILSALALDYYFLPPIHSFAIEATQLPRLLLFMAPALFIVWLSATQRRMTESLRHARNILEGTVQRLEQTNDVLQGEITERKNAEDALRKSEDHLRLVIDTIPALVWCALPDGSIDFINKRHKEFTGLSLDDVRGWRWTDVIHPDDRARAIEEWHKALATGKELKAEIRLRRAYGDYRWLLMQAVPLRDESGEIVRWYGTKTDITELKQAEDQLRKNEDHIRLIINTVPIMAWSVRTDGTVEFLNQRWIDYSGLSLDEYIKDPLGPIHPEDVPRVMDKWRSHMVSEKPYDDEMRLRRVDGEYRWFLVRTDPLHDKHGTLIKWYGVSIDIEDSKRAKDKLRQSYEEIRRLTEHLQNIREEERKTIAREIHDELGTQLTVLKMDASWLDKRLASADDGVKEKLKDLLGILDSTVQSVRRISHELRPSLLDSLGLVAAMEWHLNDFEKRSGIKTNFRSDITELSLPDEIQTALFRIFQESLTNVARHSEASWVKVDLMQKNRKLVMNIEDNGKGFILQNARENPTLGILGMKERAAMIGGRYEINSEPRKGTTITVVLPVKTETPI